LRFIQQLKTVPSYVSYFLKVVDLHSLQAPFIYGFYSELMEGIKSRSLDPEIEDLRKLMQQNQSEIAGMDYGAGTKYTSGTGIRTISTIARKGISSPKTCRLLSHILHIQHPKTILELGTSLGLTTAYLSRSEPESKIYTFEGNADLCKKAIKNWEQLKCKNIRLIKGNIDQTLPESLDHIPKVDFAIIDANHTKKALSDYYERIIQKITPNGMIFIDDIRWSVDMYDSWQGITKDPRVNVSIEFLQNGLLIFREGLSKQHYILSC